MTNYIIKRLFLLIPTLLGITFITFILIKNIPGDPVYGLIGERGNPALIEHYRKSLGLDEHFIKQYVRYLGRIIKGELGYSYYTHLPVSKIFWQKFPNTAQLAITAISVAVLGGLVLGIIAAVKQNTYIDRSILLVSAFGISLPVFWLGLILIIIFTSFLHWLPASGMGNGRLIYLVLPAITLGSRSMAYIVRITRKSMQEALNQHYIISAHARGIGLGRIILKHSLRNALIPVITMTSLDLGSYLNGAVLTETVFSWDGIGRLAVTAIFKRDYPVILGVVLFGAVIFVMVNLVTDISYQFINPKTRRD